MIQRRSFMAWSAAAIAAYSHALPGNAASGKPNSGPPAARGSFDLSDLEVIDVHTHPPAEVTPSQSQSQQDLGFVDALLPAGNYPGKEQARQRLLQGAAIHFAHNPRVLQLTEFMARAYGVPATAESIDAVVAAHIGKDFSGYLRSVLDRNKIRKILLQSPDIEPRRPKSLVPDDRFEWSYSIGPLLLPQWIREQRIDRIDDLTAAILARMETASDNGCRGYKVPIAYYRPLAFERVGAQRAERDLRTSLTLSEKAPPTSADGQDYARALRSYQDYVLKKIYVKAGELGRRIIIHTAVGLHPALRFEFNSPLELHKVFEDDDVRRAGTVFVLIHSGYPYHHHVAALLSQFPNVYSDVSFVSQYPGTLEEVLRSFLALAPSEKVLFGSDGSVAERWGMCAHNIRHVLGRVLHDYQSVYGWNRALCLQMARNVLSDNARRVYGFD